MKNNLIVFPSICATLGGAQSVSLAGRYACITQADGSKVTMARSILPKKDRWTSFNLADAALAYSGR